MRCDDTAAPEPELLRTFPLGEQKEVAEVGEGDTARRGSKELREVEVKMAGADGAKIGPLFAF